MKTKTIKSLLFAMLFLQGLFVNSQTFYETKFKDLSGNTYLGFMVYYSESNCYMRIAFTQSNVYSVVNVEYESIQFGWCKLHVPYWQESDFYYGQSLSRL